MKVKDRPVSTSSMYSKLLARVLAESDRAQPDPSAEEALAQYLRCLPVGAPAGCRAPGPHWVESALADQVAYDAALIRYARSLGLPCDVQRFGWPRDERRSTERLVASHGVLGE
jgi:hypothetical protein